METESESEGERAGQQIDVRLTTYVKLQKFHSHVNFQSINPS